MQNSTTNILRAFLTLIDRSDEPVANQTSAVNSANQRGDSLEEHIKRLLTNTFEENEQDRLEIYERCFSYSGNTHNPPDLIIKNGDAIEVKKIKADLKSLALNSSYPKDILHNNDTRISQQCRECEQWTEKDIFYAIGHVENETILKHLWIIQGKCYAANRETYTRLSDTISESLMTISDVEFEETNELARVNKVDPLGITNLRIRGMWEISHPGKVFDYLPQSQDKFANLLLLTEKYNAYPESDRNQIEDLSNNDGSGLAISDVRIKDPNNPAKLLDAKLITLKVD